MNEELTALVTVEVTDTDFDRQVEFDFDETPMGWMPVRARHATGRTGMVTAAVGSPQFNHLWRMYHVYIQMALLGEGHDA